MFDSSEWSRLVETLLKRSRSELLEWSLDQDRGLLRARVGGTDYMIGSVDNDGRPPFFLAVGDANARAELARLESDPSEDAPWDTGVKSASQRLVELRNLAMRLAQGAPQLLNKLISDLDSLDPDGSPF
jgi:hypothetical protein